MNECFSFVLPLTRRVAFSGCNFLSRIHSAMWEIPAELLECLLLNACSLLSGGFCIGTLSMFLVTMLGVIELAMLNEIWKTGFWFQKRNPVQYLWQVKFRFFVIFVKEKLIHTFVLKLIKTFV